MSWILNFLCRFLMVREIRGEDGTLYLSRYRIMGWMPGSTTKWPLSIYLHHFHRPDLDDAPHNHPWKWSFSLTLAGGYTEERADVDNPIPGHCAIEHRRMRFLSVNWISHSAYHLVSKLHGKETWTLFFAGPKATSWGFYVPGRGHVEWRARLAERGIPVPDATHEEV